MGESICFQTHFNWIQGNLQGHSLLCTVRWLFCTVCMLLLLLLSGFGFFPGCLGQQLLSLQEFLGRMFPKAVRGQLISAGSAPTRRKDCCRYGPTAEPC